jgi:hypothetical protein
MVDVVKSTRKEDLAHSCLHIENASEQTDTQWILIHE